MPAEVGSSGAKSFGSKKKAAAAAIGVTGAQVAVLLLPTAPPAASM